MLDSVNTKSLDDGKMLQQLQAVMKEPQLTERGIHSSLSEICNASVPLSSRFLFDLP